MLDHRFRYVEHLTEGDYELLAAVSPDAPDARSVRTRLRADPGLIERLLESPELHRLSAGPAAPATGHPSPFLIFGVLVNRARRDLRETTYVEEWSAPGKRLPVFDTGTLADFIEAGPRRYFIIEFLTSFTRVASGVRWARTSTGFRRTRYSELDLVGLAQVVEDLPVEQRPAGYRRLGDVALFLSGVFPDHTARHVPQTAQRERLARSADVDPARGGLAESLDFYTLTGSGWYRRAADATAALVHSGPTFLREMAERFDEARRFLNHLADRYLYHLDTGLSGPSSRARPA